jgi:hypothetical protein
LERRCGVARAGRSFLLRDTCGQGDGGCANRRRPRLKARAELRAAEQLKIAAWLSLRQGCKTYAALLCKIVLSRGGDEASVQCSGMASQICVVCEFGRFLQSVWGLRDIRARCYMISKVFSCLSDPHQWIHMQEKMQRAFFPFIKSQVLAELRKQYHSLKFFRVQTAQCGLQHVCCTLCKSLSATRALQCMQCILYKDRLSLCLMTILCLTQQCCILRCTTQLDQGTSSDAYDFASVLRECLSKSNLLRNLLRTHHCLVTVDHHPRLLSSKP